MCSNQITSVMAYNGCGPTFKPQGAASYGEPFKEPQDQWYRVPCRYHPVTGFYRVQALVKPKLTGKRKKRSARPQINMFDDLEALGDDVYYDVRAAEPEPAAAAADGLRGVFPDATEADLEKALWASGGDIERAADRLLLALAATAPAADTDAAAPDAESPDSPEEEEWERCSVSTWDECASVASTWLDVADDDDNASASWELVGPISYRDAAAKPAASAAAPPRASPKALKLRAIIEDAADDDDAAPDDHYAPVGEAALDYARRTRRSKSSAAHREKRLRKKGEQRARLAAKV